MLKKMVKSALVVFLCVIIVVLIGLPHVLSPVLQKILRSEVTRRTGLMSFSLDVLSIGIEGLGLGKITTGKTLSVDSLFLRYTIPSLLEKQLLELRVSGLDVRAHLKGTTLVFEDFIMSGARETDKIKGENTDFEFSPTLFALLPEIINIQHSVFTLKEKARTVSIPFSLSCVTQKDETSFECSLKLYPFGSLVEINIHADLQHGITAAILKANAFDLRHVNGILQRILPDFTLKDNVNIRIAMMPFNWREWELTINHVGIASPVKGAINGFTCRVSIDRGGENTEKRGAPFNLFTETMDFKSVTAEGEFQLDNDYFSALNIKYTVTADPFRNWSVEVSSEEKVKRVFELRFGDNPLKLKSCPVLRIDASGKDEKGTALFSLNLPETHMENNELKAKFSGLGITGKTAFDFSTGGKGVALAFNIDSGGLDIKKEGMHGTFPNIFIPGIFRLNRNLESSFFCRPSVEKGSFSSKEYGVDVSRIHFAFPFIYPVTTDAAEFFKKNEIRDIGKMLGSYKIPRYLPGFFDLKDISCDGNIIGSVQGEISGIPSGALLNGKVDLSFLGGVGKKKKPLKRGKKTGTGARAPQLSAPDLSFESRLGFTKNKGVHGLLRFNLKPYPVSSNVLKDRLPSIYADALTGFDFNFVLSSKGEFLFHDNALASELRMDVTRGDFSIADSGFKLQGLNTTLSLQELMPVKSKTGQLLTIDSIAINDISLLNVAVGYSIESPDSLLIENGNFDWCGGRVTSQAIRFSSEKDIYDMVLFCDRLKLSEILRQIGSFHAEGEGSLNGKIPVSYTRGNISFDNGFLYSTPGMGGNIKVQGTELLTAGIPMDSPQFAQVDLAREALKNYRYNWARLGLNTEDDGLLVKMEFDGRPEDNLPFVYKKKLGRFVRVGGSSPGSNFQGIKIDVNLKLPFNKVMKFGNKINSMF